MKKLIILFTAVLLAFSFSLSVYAKEKNQNHNSDSPLIIEEEITVTNEGGTFEVGFASIKFKKGFLNDDALPITFTVSIYAEDGEVYIEFSPDVEAFLSDVKVKATSFEGYLYDVSLEENILIQIKTQSLKVEHFSRYCWAT